MPKKKYPTRRTFSVEGQLLGKLGEHGLEQLVTQLGGREDSRPKRRPSRKPNRKVAA